MLSKLLAKTLVQVTGGIVGDMQTYAITGRTIKDNLHLLRYTVEEYGKNPGKGGILFSLYLS